MTPAKRAVSRTKPKRDLLARLRMRLLRERDFWRRMAAGNVHETTYVARAAGVQDSIYLLDGLRRASGAPRRKP